MERLARFTRIFGIVFVVGGSIGVAMGLLHARAGAHAENLSFADQARVHAAGTSEAMWNGIAGLLPGVALLLVSRWAKSMRPGEKSESRIEK